ncbi:hypothetical protein [Puniceicoccus vermicola]|uniref:Uncharacterized protein n=1 Tax=Puniceicoccus vermicola TaxID=388746 RepID=A0A7X1E3D7_9BACT|nr:hypothetical protein [Puniceicoccus vermicola]MBC2601370.1 hypothetical protein [Puniceicoccus vermicola]
MSTEKLTSSKTILFDLVLTGLFFLFMTTMLRAFVPAHTPALIWFFAGFTALPLTGVFWLASQMFRVTVTDQIRRKKAEKGA